MNVFAGANPALYHTGNAFPSVAQFEAQFSSYSTGDYRLLASSPWHDAAMDGLDLGAVLGVSIAGSAPASSAAPPQIVGHRPDSGSTPAGLASPAPPRQ